MRTLYLHLGSATSGSTLLHTAFGLSRDRLAKAGISYPAPGAGDFAAEGDESLGNDSELFPAIARASEGHMLVSGEALVGHFRDQAVADLLDRTRRAAGFDRLACLLVLRDPVDHAASVYQERVKRRVSAEPLESWFRAYRSPATTRSAMQALEAIGAEVTVRHHPADAAALTVLAETWLGLPAGELVRPTGSTRSPSRLIPSRSVQEAMLERLRDDLLVLDALLPEGEAISLRTLEPAGRQGPPGEPPPEPTRPSTARRLVGLVRRAVRGPRRDGIEAAVVADLRTGLDRRRRTEAMALLALASLGRRAVPMRRWARVLGNRTVAHSAVPSPVRLTGVEDEVSRALRVATDTVPFTASCLDQAVAGSLLLRRRGLGATVVIGLSTIDPHKSHAWLLGPSGEVLVGGIVADGFVPVTEFHRDAG